jgi:8-oxo-dGTP pyrophosphatase MutT (NUDIX family)
VARVREYFRDPGSPPARDLVPVAYAVVRDHRGWVLLVQRRDDGNWELPGGRIEVGETVAAAAIREVDEEAGITITPTGIAGVYSDPRHIIVYPIEGARQQLAVVFHAVPATENNTVRPDQVETRQAAWFDPTTTGTLRMHEAVRRRLDEAITYPDIPAFE